MIQFLQTQWKRSPLFFDAHYEEIDLLTYRLYYRNEEGKTYGHTRYQILKETAVYDLEKKIFMLRRAA